MCKELRDKIVDRQLAVRREEYENALRKSIGEGTEDARFRTTCMANYFSFCDYAKKNDGWICFSKELDFLENYFLMEQSFFGDLFKLHRDYDFLDFSIPPFTLYPLIREAALNLVCQGQPAEIWVLTEKKKDMVRIAIRHDIPEECLRDADFRTSNAYGFSLLQERIRQCGGSLVREAVPEGLMENVITLPVHAVKELGPVYVWF